MRHSELHRACFATLAIMLLTVLTATLQAQRGPSGPTNVAVASNGTLVRVSWTQPARDLRYRILRGSDPRTAGNDLTLSTGLVNTSSFDDPNARPGTTYYYQVIALYGDGSAVAAEPVGFLVPVPNPTPGQAIGTVPGTPGGRMPTAVTGVTVTGTIASAIVSWQPVAGAKSYTVTRTKPGGTVQAFPGIMNSPWTDAGPQNIGFIAPGVYQYQITAVLEGGTVSGQTSWTRPSPTCAAPDPNRGLAILDPGTPNPIGGPYPSGAVYIWKIFPRYVAFRVERSTQGSNNWVVAGTSCQGLSPMGTGLENDGAAFLDGLPGIVPGATYDYRLTAITAAGDWGANTVSWIAPGAVILRWRSATIAAGKIALNLRYEPPLTKAPVLPALIRFTGPNGLNLVGPVNACMALNGCTFEANAAPGTSNKFTATAEWNPCGPQTGSSCGGKVLAKVTADTTVVVP